MKIDYKNKMAALVAMAAVFTVAGISFAQPPPDNGPQNPPPPRGNFQRGELAPPGVRPPAQPGPGLGPLMNVLTEDQRSSLRTAMENQRAQIRELEGKRRDARRAALETTLTGKFDEEAVRARAMDVAKLDVEIAVLQAKALSQMTPPLTPGQIEKVKNAVPPQGGPGFGNGQRGMRRGPPGSVPAPAPGRDDNDLPVPPRPPPS
jgi:Spy/CpxP family protein refolding chaperone